MVKFRRFSMRTKSIKTFHTFNHCIMRLKSIFDIIMLEHDCTYFQSYPWTKETKDSSKSHNSTQSISVLVYKIHITYHYTWCCYEHGCNRRETIHHTKHLNLIYSRLGILYDILFHTPQPLTDLSIPTPRDHMLMACLVLFTLLYWAS